MAGALRRGFRAAISFLTTLPVSIEAGDYDFFAMRQYLFPLAGVAIGLLLGVAGLAFQWLLPAPVAAALVVASIYLLTGINHLDGLSDTGDGIVASGPVERKVRAMKDVHAGSGGVLFVAMDLLFLYVAVSLLAGYPAPLLFPLLIAEVGAKTAMLSIIAFGRSAGPGMGAYMIAGARRRHFYLGLALAWVVILVAAGTMGAVAGHFKDWHLWLACLAAMLSPLIVAGVLRRAADRNFGGVNGDVIGAANEVARVVSLMAMGAILWMRF